MISMMEAAQTATSKPIHDTYKSKRQPLHNIVCNVAMIKLGTIPAISTIITCYDETSYKYVKKTLEILMLIK